MTLAQQPDDALQAVTAEIRNRVRERDGLVLLRDDFADLDETGLVDQALEALIEEVTLIPFGDDGLFAKARINQFDGMPMPIGGFKTVALEALERLGVEWEFSEGEKLYREGKVLQVPGGVSVVVKGDYRPYIGLRDRQMKVEYWDEEKREWR